MKKLNSHFPIGVFSLAAILVLLAGGCNTPTVSTPLQPANITTVGPDTTQVTVDARAPWVSTGINVKAGQKYQFTAIGVWGESPGVNRSADGGQAGIFGSGYWGVIPRLPGAPWGALLGRVGTSIFLIGTAATLPMQQDGVLLLGINDGDSNVSDNHGFQTVTIKLVN
jgi:hypothetical protein